MDKIAKIRSVLLAKHSQLPNYVEVEAAPNITTLSRFCNLSQQGVRYIYQSIPRGATVGSRGLHQTKDVNWIKFQQTF